MENTNCCEKCSGRVEDENAFTSNYGCQNESCPCHQQPAEDWEEEFGQFAKRWLMEGFDFDVIELPLKDFIRKTIAQAEQRGFELGYQAHQKLDSDI